MFQGAATLYACKTCPPPFLTSDAVLGGVGLAGVIGVQVLAWSTWGTQHLLVAHHTTLTPTLACHPAAAQEAQGAQSPQGTQA